MQTVSRLVLVGVQLVMYYDKMHGTNLTDNFYLPEGHIFKVSLQYVLVGVQ